MPIMSLDGPEPGVAQGVGIGAFEQGAAAGAFPFAVLLLEFPWLQVHRAPAKIFRRHAMQGGKRRNTEARQDIRRNLVEEPSPAPKPSCPFVIQFSMRVENLRVGCA